MDTDRLLKREGYEFMAAAFEVYNEKGNGFLEDVYQECMEKELGLRNILFQAKPRLQLHYKGELLRQFYEPDLLVFMEIAVELKAVRKLAPEHDAQLLNYLRALGKRVGYLVNFGHHPGLEWKRMVL